MAEGLRIGDERRHLITFHPPGGDHSISTSSHVFSNSDPALDFNMRQNGHGDHTKTWSRIFSDYSLQPVKPVLDGEPLYEDHPISFNAAKHGYSNAHDIRRFLYLDLFAGAFGHAYGHHSVWQFHTPERGEGVNRPISYWRKAFSTPTTVARIACFILHVRCTCGEPVVQSVNFLASGMGFANDSCQAHE